MIVVALEIKKFLYSFLTSTVRSMTLSRISLRNKRYFLFSAMRSSRKSRCFKWQNSTTGLCTMTEFTQPRTKHPFTNCPFRRTSKTVRTEMFIGLQIPWCTLFQIFVKDYLWNDSFRLFGDQLFHTVFSTCSHVFIICHCSDLWKQKVFDENTFIWTSMLPAQATFEARNYWTF